MFLWGFSEDQRMDLHTQYAHHPQCLQLTVLQACGDHLFSGWAGGTGWWQGYLLCVTITEALGVCCSQFLKPPLPGRLVCAAPRFEF